MLEWTHGLSIRETSTCSLLKTSEPASRKINGFQISTVVVYCFWIFVQNNVIWYHLDHHVFIIQLTASEAIRFSQPYTTFKAIYQTAFGLRTFFICLQLHNTLNVHSLCIKSVLSKATMDIDTTIIL